MRVKRVVTYVAMAVAALVAMAMVSAGTPTSYVMLALPIGAYGHPACPAEDATHPRGCVWHGDGVTWVVYP